MSSKLNVLIPDGDSTWALSVIQCLSHIKSYRLFVLSNKKRTAAKFSKYVSYYKFHKRLDDSNWLDVVNSEIEKNTIDVVIPIAEKELSFFIRNIKNITSKAKVIPLPEFDNFETAIDKKKLSDFAKQHHIPHPKSFYISSEEEKRQLLKDAQFPVLVKPLSMKGGDGIEKIKSITSFEKYSKKRKAPLFVQEFIEGYDIDCSVLCLNGTILTYTIQKGNLKGHNDFAPQLAFEFLKNDAVLKVTQDVMSKLNWSGVAHLDLRFDKHTNTYKLIEINARFWGSVEASRHAGVNFPHLAIQLAIDNTIDNHDFEPVSFMRLKGVFKSIRRRPSFLFKRKHLLKHTEAKSFLNDPMPTLYKFREWLGRQF